MAHAEDVFDQDRTGDRANASGSSEPTPERRRTPIPSVPLPAVSGVSSPPAKSAGALSVAKAVHVADGAGNRPARGNAVSGAGSAAVVSMEQIATSARAGRDSRSGRERSPDTGRIGNAWSAEAPASPPSVSPDEVFKDEPDQCGLDRGPAYVLGPKSKSLGGYPPPYWS
ncbi:hypothetical protein OWR29_23245 [Actinoplanes sp. Pm04-4]|uniref:Uncharacterized protein n=1 Tax=Paractinoplanes pyxinae TaxID=2997416 RepID=A0ABT4B362_9ACTN|nr:hypothetical protein [Actinoplanes pyxinae]MCY1140926.1 hypothetical protein [Actinoplanes pyxinae]